jgi:hypothetical protein
MARASERQDASEAVLPQSVLAVIDRREGEQIRVTTSEYHGTTYADIRLWWKTRDGGWAPTKKGVTFGFDSIDVIIAALTRAKETMTAGVR